MVLTLESQLPYLATPGISMLPLCRSPRRPRSDFITTAYATPPMAERIYVGIRQSVGMSVVTGTHQFNQNALLPALDIHKASHGFQVGWPNAGAHSAEVINFESVRDRTVGQRIGDAMCVNDGVIADVEATVAASTDVAAPQPARISLFDLRPKGCEALFMGILREHLNFLSGVTGRDATTSPLHSILQQAVSPRY